MSDETTAQDVIDDVIDTARDEGASDATLVEMRARLQAIEDRQMSNAAPSEPVDLSPLQSAIESLGAQFASIGERLDRIESTRAEANTETEAEESEDDAGEIAPQIDVKAASTAAVKSERAPARPHMMFRRVGRR